MLRLSIYISPFIYIAQIFVFSLKLSGLACLLTVLINSRVAGVFILVLKSLIDLAI